MFGQEIVGDEITGHFSARHDEKNLSGKLKLISVISGKNKINEKPHNFSI